MAASSFRRIYLHSLNKYDISHLSAFSFSGIINYACFAFFSYIFCPHLVMTFGVCRSRFAGKRVQKALDLCYLRSWKALSNYTFT